MQIVIKMPKKLYEHIKNDNEYYLEDGEELYTIVNNGTPLPKGHGRLIDADAYIDKHEECGWLDDITVNDFNEITPTIIEADKKESEDKVCKSCRYNDGEVHAECVICDKVESEEKK